MGSQAQSFKTLATSMSAHTVEFVNGLCLVFFRRSFLQLLSNLNRNPNRPQVIFEPNFR
jgi:hypothetical protein